MEKSVLQLFPQEYRQFWQQVAKEQEYIQEIRLRVGKPAIVYRSGNEFFLGEMGNLVSSEDAIRLHTVTHRELEHILQHICQYSPYAYEEELRRGFLTVAGGHRIGVTGQVVQDGSGSVRTIKNISCLNIRVSHQIVGAANKILPRLYQNQTLKSILIISPPGCGKTTILRDLVRQISDGNDYSPGLTVGVVDERSELAGSYLGIAQNDLGMRTDVLDACPKREGMLMLLRSMSPQVIAVDEVGEQDEWEMLRRASACGCKLLATVHGDDLADVERRFDIDRDRLQKMFDLFLILGRQAGKCVVESILETGR